MNSLIEATRRANTPSGIHRHRVKQSNLLFDDETRLRLLHVGTVSDVHVAHIVEECAVYALPLLRASLANPAPQPKHLALSTQVIRVRFDPTIHQAVNELAVSRATSAFQIVRLCVALGLPRWEEGVPGVTEILAGASRVCGDSGEPNRQGVPQTAEAVQTNESNPEYATVFGGFSEPRRRCENAVPRSGVSLPVQQGSGLAMGNDSNGDSKPNCPSSRNDAGPREAKSADAPPPAEKQSPLRASNTDRASIIEEPGKVSRDGGTNAPVGALLQELKRPDEFSNGHEHQGNLGYRASKVRLSASVRQCIVDTALNGARYGLFTSRDLCNWLHLPTTQENLSRFNAWCESMVRQIEDRCPPLLKRVNNTRPGGKRTPAFQVLTDEERLEWERACRKYGIFGFPRGSVTNADKEIAVGDIQWI